MKKKVVMTMIGCLCLVMITGCGVTSTLGEEQLQIPKEEQEKLDNIQAVDYTHVDSVVQELLKRYSSVDSEIERIKQQAQNSSDADILKNIQQENEPVQGILDTSKTEFRLAVERKLMNQKTSENQEKLAQTCTEKYARALTIAEQIYGVTITQEEVTEYIAKNIAPVVVDEKKAYAEALGLTLYELDYIFDRDIYAMDTLWNKIIPVLLEKYPKQDGEDDNQHMERVKETFYSNEIS